MLLLRIPLSWLFAMGAYVRGWAYDRSWLPSTRPLVPTISIGGLEAGGSGKTPVTAKILQILLDKQRNPGLLTRGYGRPTRKLAIRAPGTIASAALHGDEPAMLIASGLDIPVGVFAKRSVTAQILVEQFACDTLVLDDGFSHRRLQRDLEIVVLRGEQPFGNGHFLPRGTLRELPASLKRAHIVWLHFRKQPPLEVSDWLGQYCPQATIVVSIAQPTPIYDQHDQLVQPNNQRVVVAAGIAQPRDLFDSLPSLNVIERIAFPDHHRYTAYDVTQLTSQSPDAVVVTPKDAIKLKRLWRTEVPLWIQGTEVQILQGEASLHSVIVKVCRTS
jgi:tetraacyldisaccharide 4'-kinase